MKILLTLDIEKEDQQTFAQEIYSKILDEQIHFWLESALQSLQVLASNAKSTYPELAQTALNTFSDFYVALIFVDSEKSQNLNFQYRQKNKPTNILSFPSPIPVDFYQVLPKEEQQFTLGDLVVDLSTLKKEAEEQNKIFASHLAHILLHGLLHLLGFDHESQAEAEIMETLEIKLLDQLGIHNPYESD